MTTTMSRAKRQMIDYNVERFDDYKGERSFTTRLEFSDGRYEGQGAKADSEFIRQGLEARGWRRLVELQDIVMVHPDGRVRVRFTPVGKKSDRSFFEKVVG